jgi:molybdate transport system permease protein
LHKPLGSFDLDVILQAGRETNGLLGASGAGKSMTFRMIAGIERPLAGRIELNGRLLYDSKLGVDLPAAYRRIGMVFQDYALFPHMTVFENVAYSLPRQTRNERCRRVNELLEALGIAHLESALPAEISGGERQRVAIARCLAMNPEALLFDEPFSALDPHLRRSTEEQLRRALRSYRGVVLFITHDMEEAFRFCSQLAVLDRGKVIASGPRQALFENPRTPAAARLTGCKNIAAARRVDEHRVQVEAWDCTLTTPRPVAEKVSAAGYRSHQFSFEDDAGEENVFPCWLMEVSEAPHEVTLYLRLHAAPRLGDLPHIQADLAKQAWRRLAKRPQPWKIQFDPDRLLLLKEF